MIANKSSTLIKIIFGASLMITVIGAMHPWYAPTDGFGGYLTIFVILYSALAVAAIVSFLNLRELPLKIVAVVQFLFCLAVAVFDLYFLSLNSAVQF